MNRVLALGANVPRTCARQISMTEARLYKPDLSKITKKQLMFQEQNEVPIYLKGGLMDYVLYYGSLALVVVGVGASLHSTYKLATRK